MRRRTRSTLRAALAIAFLGSLVLAPPARSQEGRSAPGSLGRVEPRVALLTEPDVLVGPEFWLCASRGTATMPDGVAVGVWGYSADANGSAAGGCEPAALPGPTLEVAEGDAVTIHVTNLDVPEPVSVVVPGLGGAPDVTGVDAGGSATYTFQASAPGTYLYGSAAGDQRGVLLGLYGALIVHPGVSGQAYGTPESAYDVGSLLVLSELDVDLAEDPINFDLDRYAPEYWLINGSGHPEIGDIEATAGDRVLLRYVNAGSLHHTMTLLGAHQRVIAKDAYPTGFPYDVVAETIPAGSTLDAIVTVPAAARIGDRLPLYSRQLHLTNDGSFPGGMLTFIRVTGTTANLPPEVNAGPDLAIAFPDTASLDGTVTDDGLPAPGLVTVTWSNETPAVGAVTFGDPNAVDTTASFSAPGTYVLRLTAFDGALSAYDETQVVVSDLIFEDGFESGNFSAWSARIDSQSDLSVSPIAAMEGSYGMAALIDDTTAMYVRDDSPSNEARYRARFSFDPNGIAMASGNRHRIMAATNGVSELARVDVRWTSTDGYQLLASVRDDAGVYASTAWTPITDAPHAIEIDWRAASAPGANDGSLSLYVDGTLVQTLGGIDNDTHRVQQARLGPQRGIDAGTSGTELFDRFVSRRASPIGP